MPHSGTNTKESRLDRLLSWIPGLKWKNESGNTMTKLRYQESFSHRYANPHKVKTGIEALGFDYTEFVVREKGQNRFLVDIIRPLDKWERTRVIQHFTKGKASRDEELSGEEE